MSANPMLSPLLWTLVALQIAMGGFDVIVHHELTERLAWKPNAGRELKLHAWRNVFYAVLFASFAVMRPTGFVAGVLIALMAVEIVITLWDFVEEDMTRKLPPSERCLHTLLAINYGAILALIGPEIVRWAALPSGIERADYGPGSVILILASAGVALFALRDFYTSRRAFRLGAVPEAAIGDILGERRHILVTGGTGFVGSALVVSLVKSGHDVTVLTRSVAHAGHLATPVRLVTSLDAVAAGERFDAIVNLAGAPIAGWLWTKAYRREIVASRLRTIDALRRLIARLETKPAVVIGASAVGFYGDCGDEILTEADGRGAKTTFSQRSCAIVERGMGTLAAPGVRIVNLRIGLVLGRDGGLLGRMLPAFDLALGGPIGSGQQWMIWIALPDLVQLIAFAIANPELDGAVNATAPVPVCNRDFAAALGHALGRPAILPLPALPLRMALGDFAVELLLTGQRVLPAKAEAAGFRFTYREIGPALAAAAGRGEGGTCISPSAGQSSTSRPWRPSRRSAGNQAQHLPRSGP